MNTLLGWVRAGRTAPEHETLLIVEAGDLAEVRSRVPLGDRRDWLVAVQSCFRAFEAFLPNVRPGDPPSEDRIRDRFEDLGGCGQLRVRFALPLSSRPADAGSGRAYLAGLRQRRLAYGASRSDAEAALKTLAAALPARRSLLHHGDRAVTLDLLMSRQEEAGLARTLAAAIEATGDCVLASERLAVSGLWAPLSFAGARPD